VIESGLRRGKSEAAARERGILNLLAIGFSDPNEL
jgi:hypothetical protein